MSKCCCRIVNRGWPQLFSSYLRLGYFRESARIGGKKINSVVLLSDMDVISPKVLEVGSAGDDKPHLTVPAVSSACNFLESARMAEGDYSPVCFVTVALDLVASLSRLRDNTLNKQFTRTHTRNFLALLNHPISFPTDVLISS